MQGKVSGVAGSQGSALGGRTFGRMMFRGLRPGTLRIRRLWIWKVRLTRLAEIQEVEQTARDSGAPRA